MYLSVIIPTLNEAENLKKLLPFLIQNMPKDGGEIIVSDGGSTDESLAIARQFEVRIVQSPKRGRATQMNYGVGFSKGTVLQFIHADTLPPPTFYEDVAATIAADFAAGCFTYRFDSERLILKINGYFTQFDKLWCRGGDQAIFIKRSVFNELGGYRPDFLIMEEYELLKALQVKYPFKIIKKDALVSARKYEQNPYLRVQVANFLVFNMYRLGYSQEKMATTYKKMLG